MMQERMYRVWERHTLLSEQGYYSIIFIEDSYQFFLSDFSFCIPIAAAAPG
jgi:hypothetical protein